MVVSALAPQTTPDILGDVVSKWDTWDKSCPSMEVRFHPLRGAMPQKKAKQSYVLPGFGSWSRTWLWPGGTPRFIEHSLNARGLETTIDECEQMICEKGIYEDLRSYMIVMPQKSNPK